MTLDLLKVIQISNAHQVITTFFTTFVCSLIFFFLMESDHKGMHVSLTFHLQYALEMSLGCIPRIIAMLVMEENVHALMLAKMKQCLLVNSRSELDFLTSYIDLFAPTRTSCCALTILVGKTWLDKSSCILGFERTF